jgi:hypothetical protein
MPFELVSFAVGIQKPLSLAATIPIQVMTEIAAKDVLSQDRVTRPYMEDFATLVVRDFSKKILCATDHFILSMMVETDQEKSSARFSVGDPVLYLARGRHLRMYSYSGFLIDSLASGPGIASWMSLYDEHLRGTKCVKNSAVVELETRKLFRRGYINSAVMAQEATRPQMASFSFTMFVIEEKNR